MYWTNSSSFNNSSKVIPLLLFWMAAILAKIMWDCDRDYPRDEAVMTTDIEYYLLPNILVL